MSTATRSATSGGRYLTVHELQDRYGLARSVAYRLAQRFGPRRPPAGLYESDLTEWLQRHPGYMEGLQAEP